MAEPILFVQGERTDGNLGFAPHGAGRNYSRTRHKKTLEGESDAQVFKRETAGIDARFASGRIDVSELPSAYKNAERVQADMRRFDLCDVVDRIMPHGAIMAGEYQPAWRKEKDLNREVSRARARDLEREKSARKDLDNFIRNGDERDDFSP